MELVQSSAPTVVVVGSGGGGVHGVTVLPSGESDNWLTNETSEEKRICILVFLQVAIPS